MLISQLPLAHHTLPHRTYNNIRKVAYFQSKNYVRLNDQDNLNDPQSSPALIHKERHIAPYWIGKQVFLPFYDDLIQAWLQYHELRFELFLLGVPQKT